jgi:hypothetical protein
MGYGVWVNGKRKTEALAKGAMSAMQSVAEYAHHIFAM